MGQPPYAELIHAVIARTPTLSKDELPVEVDTTDLICFWLDGTSHYPQWQFGEDGNPVEGVCQINQILQAAHYPLVALDWWQTPTSEDSRTPEQRVGELDNPITLKELLDLARLYRK